MTTVEVDFNNIDGSGHVRVLPSTLVNRLSLGDTVTAVDRLEGLEFEGTVVEILADGGVALAMEWEPVEHLAHPGIWSFGGVLSGKVEFTQRFDSVGCVLAHEPVWSGPVIHVPSNPSSTTARPSTVLQYS